MERLQVPAAWESWQSILGHARGRADAFRIGAEARARLEVCLDELFTNSLRHGGLAAQGGQVAVVLDRTGDGGVTLIWEDDGPPFDPVAWLAANPVPVRTSQDREGGVGLALIAGWASEIDYQRDNGWNRTRLVLPP